MRVIVANDFGYLDGGASVVALDQAQLLRRRGHDVDFFVGQTQPDDNSGVHLTEVGGIRTMSLGCPSIWDQSSPVKAAVTGMYNPQVYSALATLVSMGPSHSVIVLVHSWTKALSPSIFAAVQRLNLHSVLVLHDFFVACPTGSYFDFLKSHNCSRRPMGVACVLANCDRNSRSHKWWRTVRHAVAQEFCGMPRGVDRLVCVSCYQENIIRPWVHDQEKLVILPNRVRGLTATIEGQTPDQRTPSFAFLGRLSEEKGVRRFALASQSANVQVAFFGEGPLRAELENSLPQARFTGWLSPDAVAMELQQLTALVCPSLCRESFGLVVYEAASIGTPSIVPAGTAMSSFVKHGVNGLVFQSDAQLAELLREAAQRPQWMAQLGVQAEKDFRAYAESISDYDLRLEQILNGVVNGL